jgi:outer membrane lipoprotein-sorting protein/peroxiredoxin
MGLIHKVAATGRSIKTFELEYSSLQEMSFSNQMSSSSAYNQTTRSEYLRHSYGVFPGKFRQEQNPESLTIYDGDQRWDYDGTKKEYTRTSGFKGNWLGYFTVPFEDILNAQVASKDEIELAGARVPVTVVEGERRYSYSGPDDCHKSKVTFWIDTTRNLALKTFDDWTCGSRFARITTTVRKVVINQRLPDSLFKFTPPDGAVEVREFTRGRTVTSVGRPAANFELRDATGAYVTPAAWRGNIVVLRFSMVEMSDDALPFMELLHRAYRSRGVVALVVTSSLDKNFTQNLDKDGYTLPTATDPGLSASKALGLNSAPGWAVLDRDGTVLAAGSPSLRQLTLTLKKAGIW